MVLTLRTAPPHTDPGIAALLDAAFERKDRESRLARALAAGHPDFDPGLALMAEDDGRPVGWALFLPHTLRIRGGPVRLAVSSPVGVLPAARRRGVGAFLLRAGFAALADRGIRGAVAIGVPEFFGSSGYAPAFDLYTAEASRALLPAGDTSAWRALRDTDIPALRAMQRASYAGVDGTEERGEAVIDWESSTESSHTLVLQEGGSLAAHLRFRLRNGLEVRECSVRGDRGVRGVLHFLRRLCDEHGEASVDVHVPPPHPVARELFHRGAEMRSNNFHGAALLKVTDWPGLLADTAPAWEQALTSDAFSMEVDGRTVHLSRTEERRPGRHLAVPEGWGPALLTGQRSWRDLFFDERVEERSDLDGEGRRLVRALFPGGTPMWTYSPVFEIADE